MRGMDRKAGKVREAGASLILKSRPGLNSGRDCSLAACIAPYFSIFFDVFTLNSLRHGSKTPQVPWFAKSTLRTAFSH